MHLARLKNLVRENGIALEYSNRLGPAEGLSAGGRIMIKAGLELASEFAVLAHELAHSLLHCESESRPDSKTVRETEAEAVAFVVCQAVSLETRSAASDYIQLYNGNKETLLACLERVQHTASVIIEGVLGPGCNLDRSGKSWDSVRRPSLFPACEEARRVRRWAGRYNHGNTETDCPVQGRPNRCRVVGERDYGERQAANRTQSIRQPAVQGSQRQLEDFAEFRQERNSTGDLRFTESVRGDAGATPGSGWR